VARWVERVPGKFSDGIGAPIYRGTGRSNTIPVLLLFLAIGGVVAFGVLHVVRGAMAHPR
jgi:hypothetical protein